ncbi:MAG: hypothetical protein IPP49_07070 [Saprospiraceae bacterium]|nr:hypothetical protein [Saprospiraceae bacterium]
MLVFLARKAVIFLSEFKIEETVYFLDGVRVVAGTKDLKTPEEKGQAGLVTAGSEDPINWGKWAELLKR